LFLKDLRDVKNSEVRRTEPEEPKEIQKQKNWSGRFINSKLLISLTKKRS
jgi:hypothetical protein